MRHLALSLLLAPLLSLGARAVAADAPAPLTEINLPAYQSAALASDEPIRDLLLQMFMGEKFGQDSVWERHLGREVHQTVVDIEAVLDEKPISLGEIMNLQVGSTIMLNANH